MAKINGTDILVSTDTGAIGGATSHTLNVNIDLPEATTKDSGGWAENIHGLRDWSVDIDALVDPDNPVDGPDLVQLALDRTEVTLTMALTGGHTYTGTAKLANYSETPDMEQPVAFSASFTGNGPLELAMT